MYKRQEYKYKGEKYHFCNPSCEAEFKRDPEKYKNFENINPRLMHKQVEEEETVIDPVCGMKGKPEDWIGHEHEGQKYYFCNQSCVVEFKKNPEKYIKMEKEKEKIISEEFNIKKEDEKELGKLKCTQCGVEQDIPMHCGQPMHKEGNELVCWMGKSCGFQEIPKHHGKPMEITE